MDLTEFKDVQGNIFENEETILGLINQMALARRMEQKAYALLVQAEKRHKLQAENRIATFARCKNELKEFCILKGIPFDESEFN